jgi:hypothetical protein
MQVNNFIDKDSYFLRITNKMGYEQQFIITTAGDERKTE